MPDQDAPRIFTCTACGSPVPLGDGDAVPCPSCRALVPVPDALRELRESERTYANSRAEARALLERLGKVPVLPVRLLVTFASRMGVGTFMVLLPVLVVVHALLCAALFTLAYRAARSIFHVDLEDTVLYRYDAGALSFIGEFGGIALSFAALVFLAAYERKRGAALRELQAGLRATPPTAPGGPSRCRSCGAPLAIGPGALAATCPYCRADNLVHIPEKWIVGVRARSTALEGTIERAAAEYQREQSELRSSLKRRLVFVIVAGGLLMTFIFGVTNGGALPSFTTTPYQSYENGALWRFDWRDEVSTPILRLDLEDAKGGRFFDYTPRLDTRPCVEAPRSPLVIPPGACDAEACVLHYYVALRRGDALEVSSADLPAESLVTLKSHSRGTPFNHDARGWGETIPERFGWLANGTGVRLEAPHDGWFQVLLAAKGASSNAAYDLCVVLGR